MKNKKFYIALSVIVLGFVGLIVFAKLGAPPEPLRPGVEQKDLGREHVPSANYGGEQPPTSGSHASPVSWGQYDTEVRDDQIIHNLEHGGVYVSYRPDLSKDQVTKLVELLTEPFSDSKFQPKKIVLAPRANNKYPIELSSWLRSETLTSYNKDAIKDYIVRNLGKSPEPLAN